MLIFLSISKSPSNLINAISLFVSKNCGNVYSKVDSLTVTCRVKNVIYKTSYYTFSIGDFFGLDDAETVKCLMFYKV
uniref:Uncharacterized protein n=2 Tax=Heterorhabditis bacteriophora TaxID=37862 RepID=A0A1I7WHC7_HETBA